ncbi:Transcription factor ABORTED MICROSPORES [Sesamum alatum]|uniref:Transcription factor ABORTED MICROSPORES n=1 Tax=Sesamum alatum TaxID=300844 RepID=A0AAE1YWM4_9LAMI|nr:Transcription factor ABORTED MICROSPORES [Sesamum alatum]
MLVEKFLERLRPLVGDKCWDNIFIWKLSDDHRSLELMDSICAETQHIQKHGGPMLFPAAVSWSDASFPHSRIETCGLSEHIPSSTKQDSGIHAEVLLSNHSRWLHFSYNSDSNASEELLSTRVLVALPLGLVELFATKRVPEDEQVINFIKTQWESFLKENASSGISGYTDSRFSFSSSGIEEIPSLSFLSDANLQKDLSSFQKISTDPCKEKSEFPNSIIHLATSEIMNDDKRIFAEGTHELDPFTPSAEMEMAKSHMISGSAKWVESSGTTGDDHMNGKIPPVEENRESDDSDPNKDDENDGKYRKRMTGKGHQSKNLEAERKRRKKLNDRLYSLRALVPKISKLDRTAILGDAINYVKELQKQVEDLQIELEQQSDNENSMMVSKTGNDNSMSLVTVHQTGTKRGHENFLNVLRKESSGSNGGITTSKQNHEVENMNSKVQQMEPQVEVFQMDENEFFIKVFCEHKPGGFLRLMEAITSLGLQVVNVNATRHTCLVSNIFRVEKRESELIQADRVKESLLELARSPLRAWDIRPNTAKASYIYNSNSRGQMNSQFHQH